MVIEFQHAEQIALDSTAVEAADDVQHVCLFAETMGIFPGVLATRFFQPHVHMFSGSATSTLRRQLHVLSSGHVLVVYKRSYGAADASSGKPFSSSGAA